MNAVDASPDRQAVGSCAVSAHAHHGMCNLIPLCVGDSLRTSLGDHTYDCVASKITNIIADQLISHTACLNRQRMQLPIH
jgi:hypothetical protein